MWGGVRLRGVTVAVGEDQDLELPAVTLRGQRLALDHRAGDRLAVLRVPAVPVVPGVGGVR